MRHKSIKGRIYIINDSLLSRDGYWKQNRRVVAINNNKRRVHVMKIKSLYDKNGKMRNLIPIENYNCLTKPSGIEKRVYNTTRFKTPIREKKMFRTNSRLNKWDMDKIKNYK